MPQILASAALSRRALLAAVGLGPVAAAARVAGGYVFLLGGVDGPWSNPCLRRRSLIQGAVASNCLELVLLFPRGLALQARLGRSGLLRQQLWVGTLAIG